MFTFYKKYVIIHANRKMINIKQKYIVVFQKQNFLIYINGLWENPTKNPNISHKEKIK